MSNIKKNKTYKTFFFIFRNTINDNIILPKRSINEDTSLYNIKSNV